MIHAEIRSQMLEKEINALIAAGLYADTSELITDALATLLEVKKPLRLAAAVELYKQGEVTLGKAAELAGLHRFEFEVVLKEKRMQKISPEETPEEIKAGVDLIKKLRSEGSKNDFG